jgi:rhomboid family GlyGly-CTERM serine protease
MREQIMTRAQNSFFQSVLCQAQRIPLTLFITSVAALLHVAHYLQPWLVYDFNAIETFDFWRLFTCHLLHWSNEHLFWDVAVFAVLGAGCELRSLRRYAWTLILTAIAVPLCVMYWAPDVGSYRGLSGIDTALFGLFVSDLIQQRIKDRDRAGTTFYAMLLFGLFGKICFELISRENVFVSDTSFTPVPIAHLVGAGIGLAVSLYGAAGLAEKCSNHKKLLGLDPNQLNIT